ncbi:MAG: DUF4124 domain-containing protein [Pseudomonadota bacterium]
MPELRLTDRMSAPVWVLLAALISLFGNVAVHAEEEMFRWVDANGVINYSERKPRGVPESAITRIADRAPRPSTSPVAQTPIAAQSPVDTRPLNPEQQQMLDRLQTAESARQETVAQIRKDNCERSQRVLENLTSRGRVRVAAEDGSQRVMAEEERQARIAEAQRGIATNCA